MKKNDESRFKVQQTKLKTSGEKIADGCFKGEQSHNENKKCQAEKSVMWPVKPKEYIQLEKPLAKDKKSQVTLHNKKQVPLSKDNNCKSIRSYNKSMYSDKNCQENNVMQSVTKETDVQLPKPIPYEYRRICKDKHCQSTGCYQKRVPRDQCMTKTVSCNLNIKELH